MKHSTPCGVAIETLGSQKFTKKLLNGDPVFIYLEGLAMNYKVDNTAEELNKTLP